MSIIINKQMLNKLAHDLPEIRKRALKDLEGKITRALLQNETIYLQPSDLIKALIKWFGNSPVSEEETVLNLILIILNSKYGIEAVKMLSTEIIVKEIFKIKNLLTSTEHKNLTDEIFELIKTINSQILENEALQNRNQFNNSTIDFETIDLTAIDEALDDCIDYDFIKCWDMPSPVEMESINNVKISLNPESDSSDLAHALKFFKAGIKDYPAEYFLQPPYLYRSLLKLVESPNVENRGILGVLTDLTKSLQRRVIYRQVAKIYCWNKYDDVSSYNQIKISKFCSENILKILNLMKEMSCEENLYEMTQCFNLINELISLTKGNNLQSDVISTILTELGNFAHYFRKSSVEFSNRSQYITSMNLIGTLLETSNFINRKKFVDSVQLNRGRKYNPIDFQSISLTDFSESLDEKNWMHELQICLADYPLKKIYPMIYEKISKAVETLKSSETYQIKTLLNCHKELEIVAEILRQSTKFSDYDLLMNGSMCVDTLCLHQSEELIELLFKAITNLIPQFDGNLKLKEAGENLLLRLLANSNIDCKRLVYRLCAEKVKYFMSSVRDGETMLGKSYSTDNQKCKSLGIPLNVDIIREIICFGYRNEDTKIHCYSETILLMIINGKIILGKYWENISELIIPLIPLLQCLTDPSTKLGKAVLQMFKSNTDLTEIQILQANIRFLFSENPTVRDEAISSILEFLVASDPKNDFHPNINHIADTILNTVCFLDKPYDVSKRVMHSADISAVLPLLEIMRSKDVEPSIRKTTLLQLNVMAEDRMVHPIIQRENGYVLALAAIQNGLSVENNSDYQEIVQPAIGIIFKMCLNFSDYRELLIDDLTFHFFLLKSLFLFNDFIAFRSDCVSTLFLLAFHDFIIGNREISLPNLFKQLKIPVVCKYHWETSPFDKKSSLDELLLYSTLIDKNDDKSSDRCSVDCATTRLSINESINQQNQPKTFINKTIIWQYLRISFATMWFNGFNNIFDCVKKCKKEYENKSEKLDYSALPINLTTVDESGVVDLCGVLEFNKELHVNQNDLNLIKATSVTKIFRYYLKMYDNASGHTDVIAAIEGIESIPMSAAFMEINLDVFMKSLRRLYSVAPNGQMDMVMYVAVLKFMGRFVDFDNQYTLRHIQKEFESTYCTFLTILEDKECNPRVFEELCIFLSKVVKHNSISSEITESQHEQIVKKIYETLAKICFAEKPEKDVNKLLPLINMFRILTVTEKLDLNEPTANKIINQLFKYVSILKSFSQAGAHFNKNCLYSIGNLMKKMKELKIEEKYVKLLSGLCGHSDFEIRAVSCSILSKLAEKIGGAYIIVRQLSYLPGGIHACCLSTVLDMEETGLVKLAAAGIFVNLISHQTPSKGLHLSVAPMCEEHQISPGETPIDLVFKTVEKQNFYKDMLKSLEYFSVSEIVDLDHQSILISCEVIRAYSQILIALINLKPEAIDEFIENGCALRLSNIIPASVPLVPSKTSLLMISDVCNFISRCFVYSDEFLRRFDNQNHASIAALTSFVQVKSFDLFSTQEEASLVFINILKTLQIIGNTTLGFEFLCSYWEMIDFDKFVEFLIFGLKFGSNSDLKNEIMIFSTSLLQFDQNVTSNPTFIQLLEITEVNIGNENFGKYFQASKEKTRRSMAISNENVIEIKLEFASEILFLRTMEIFDYISLKNKTNQGNSNFVKQKRICFSFIQILLKSSEKARAVANKVNFLSKLIEKLDLFISEMGMSCTEFIRRFGDAKKDPIVIELTLLIGIIKNWYTNDTIVDKNISGICRIFLKLWPWTSTNVELQLELMECLVFLSQNSIFFAKAIVGPQPGFSHTLLSLIVVSVSVESTKIKNVKCNFNLLQAGLRVLINCCLTIEGRIQITKLNVLDFMSRLHPAITKLSKSLNVTTMLWLKFYDVYTRYPEGSNSLKNINLLSALVTKCPPEIRTAALVVVRNICFAPLNRTAIISSADFFQIVKHVLEAKEENDHFLIVTSIWKLIANNSKGINYIKNSFIPRILIKIKESLQLTDDYEENDLYSVIEIVENILSK